MKMMIRGALVFLGTGPALGAQSVVVADSLMRRGDLDRAESAYYAVARVRPRDPVARWGLGRYLSARGALKVAVTLFEEALQFGGDPSLIHPDLAPLYLALGDYHALSGLSSATLTSGERERARWLEAHPTRVIAPDSIVLAGYRATSDSGWLGWLPIRLNGRTIEAAISATVSGIVLSDSAATAFRIRRFPATGAQRGASGFIVGAADSLGLARLTVTNPPVRVGSTRAPVVVGLDLLGRFAPTFEPQTGRVTLRVSGPIPSALPGDRFPTWITSSDLRVLQAGGWLSVSSERIASLLAQRTWTFDAKRGQLIVAR
jgi:hypothetical protein